MSADEFDPFVERLFARTPHMADAADFAAGVETRLASSSRFRTVALSVAGVIGGVIAVRESIGMRLNLSPSDGPVAGESLGRGIESASVTAQGAIQGVMDQVGLSDLGLGSMGDMQLFWVMAGLLVALAGVGVMKLSQEI